MVWTWKQQLSKSSKNYQALMQVKVFKCGLLIHPDIYWMGCSPDGVIYDPNENPSVGILEIKSLFLMKGKSVEECMFRT